LNKRFYGVVVLAMVALVAPRIVQGTFLCGARIQGSLASVLPTDASEDPVVEEPIRPLTPPGSPVPSAVAARCGPIEAFTLIGGLAMLAPLRILRRRSGL